MTVPRRRAAAGEALFQGGGKRKIRVYCHAKQFALHIKNRTAAMGCPVFDDMGVFISNISALALAFDWPMTTELCPLFTVHCSLLIAHCQLPIRPQKKFPGAGPRAYCICNIVCSFRGPAPGKVSPGEAPEGPASPKGFTGWDGPGKSEADFSSGE